MCWLDVLFTFATLDTNEGEVEGEEFGEGFEEDQGQANQGKPSIDLWNDVSLDVILLLFLASWFYVVDLHIVVIYACFQVWYP